MSLADWIIGRAQRRVPDFVIGERDRPYILRWFQVPRNSIANAYLHRIMRSDDDRALHDHPWWNVSILLRGRYVEHSIDAGGINRRVERRAGAIKFRLARAAHRLEIMDGEECWSLFLTGPRFRTWGFHCPARWVDWRQFTAAGEPGQIGAGCGE